MRGPNTSKSVYRYILSVLLEEKTVNHRNSPLVELTACSHIHDSRCVCELTRIVQDLSEQRVGVEEEGGGAWLSRTRAVNKCAKPDIESCNVSGFCSLI